MLELHFHPLSSFCHKALIALYENGTPFEPRFLDLFDEEASAAFKRLWPLGKMPVLRDTARDRTVAEATIIVEYLALHHPGGVKLIPADPDEAVTVRLADRFWDLHVHVPMQKIVTDKLRPEGERDRYGVAEAKRQLATALDFAESELATRQWAAGQGFTMADCAAAPPLFYIDRMTPLAPDRPNLAAYLDRLKARPGYARVLEEVKPYLHLFPG